MKQELIKFFNHAEKHKKDRELLFDLDIFADAWVRKNQPLSLSAEECLNIPFLDNEIEKLNLLNRTEDLSDYGKEMLTEFKTIKQNLTDFANQQTELPSDEEIEKKAIDYHYLDSFQESFIRGAE